eukprot:TRINITY_DN9010_c0_g3_i1.p1 TRINITY_DN9010_c0_g3~~TRINITY_DN9010_c0_g3_i1.p1  ORF type:complete len:449 (+),score=72.25 TRINITY_DN9010_c0_g3_i1:65-1348(+)
MRQNRILAAMVMLSALMMGTMYMQLVRVSIMAQEASYAEIKQILKGQEASYAEIKELLKPKTPIPTPVPTVPTTPVPTMAPPSPSPATPTVAPTAAPPVAQPTSSPTAWGLLPDRPAVHPEIERMWFKTMNATAERKFLGSCTVEVPVVHVYNGFDDDIYSALETNKSFGWVRLGDGEVMCLGNARDGVIAGAHCNADTKYAFKKSIAALPHLRNVFTSIGTWWLCSGRVRTGIHSSMYNAIRGTDVLSKGYSFLNSFYLSYGASDGPEQPGIVRSCRGRDVVLIGPKHLDRMKTGDMFNIVNHIVVSGSGRLSDVMPALNEARNYAANRTNLVFLVAFGVHAKILIVQGTQMMPGHTFIDVGSSLDAYVGVRSRDYNRDLKRFCDGWPRWMGKGVCSGLGYLPKSNVQTSTPSKPLHVAVNRTKAA